MRRALEIMAFRGRLSYIVAPKTFEADLAYNTKELYKNEKCIIGCNSLAYSSGEMGAMM